MIASPSTYQHTCKPSNTLAMLDRMAAEDMAWIRTPFYLRRPGYFSGVDAVLIVRKGVLEPVALSDLTALELDKLLSVPAFTAGVRS